LTKRPLTPVDSEAPVRGHKGTTSTTLPCNTTTSTSVGRGLTGWWGHRPKHVGSHRRTGEVRGRRRAVGSGNRPRDGVTACLGTTPLWAIFGNNQPNVGQNGHTVGNGCDSAAPACLPHVQISLQRGCFTFYLHDTSKTPETAQSAQKCSVLASISATCD
jgi:hypothetical protein